MPQCRRCGREATHVEYDGYDSDYTCEKYPQCVGETHRDPLGKKVRAIWIQWAHQQPVAATKPHWVTPYEELPEADKEVDRRIGERLFAEGRGDLRRARAEARDATLREAADLCAARAATEWRSGNADNRAHDVARELGDAIARLMSDGNVAQTKVPGI